MIFKCEWCGAQIIENEGFVSQGCGHWLKNCLAESDFSSKSKNNFISYEVWIQCANTLGYETVSDWLYCEYDEGEKTFAELSRISGISETAIKKKTGLFCNCERKIDWEQKAALQGYPDEKTWLFTEYAEKRKKIMEIALDSNVSYSGIRNRIKMYCVLRNRNDYR